MANSKRITPGTRVGLKLTPTERTLILEELTILDAKFAKVVRETPSKEAVQFTPDELDHFGGYIASEAHHAKDNKLAKTLDGIFTKVQKVLQTNANHEPVATLKFVEARTSKLISGHAAFLAEWAASALVAADQLGIKDQPLQRFWLPPAHRELLLLLQRIPDAARAKVADEKAKFTLAEIANMMMALAEQLPDGDVKKQVAFLFVAKHLMEQLHEAVALPATLVQEKDTERQTRSRNLRFAEDR